MADKVCSIYSREAAGCTVDIEAYYLKDWKGYDMALHSHSRMEIMYVVSGRCAIKMQDCEVGLKKGEFILVDESVQHGLKVADDAVCRILNIEFSMGRNAGLLPLGVIAERYPLLKQFVSEPRPFIVFIDTQDIYGILRRLINCLDATGPGQEFEIELLTAELLTAIAGNFNEANSTRHVSHQYIHAAMKFMNQNYYRDIGMKDIGAHVGIAPAYLSRIFRKDCNETVMDYLAGLRVNKARMLLGRTEMPVVEIAGYVGISNSRYFMGFFKKRTGMTPGEYRQDIRSRDQSYTQKASKDS